MGYSKLRPELVGRAGNVPIPNDTALFLIRDAVEKRRALGHGALDDPKTGLHCALGAFWEDNPRTSINWSVIDEVAAVNDSVKPGPNAARLRWQKVRSWLRWKVRVLALKADSA
jgi:hypothetical protein